ncbi:MAG: hypothetical protein EPO26_05995 [Chloroflexota bacterium]|nr:MAG: hypothetical protein EPO26_05995 [Chloroflexota bacterium]
MSAAPPDRLGEIVAVTSTSFTAQCYEKASIPAFGSFVRAQADGRDIIAIVAGITSGSIDPSRRVSARGENEFDDDAIWRNNPELSALIRTEFRATIVGFLDDGIVQHQLPDRPPRLHAFVFGCDRETIARFARRHDFLSVLLANGRDGSIDALVGAALRHAARASEDARAYLVGAGRVVAPSVEHDARRLAGILRVASS